MPTLSAIPLCDPVLVDLPGLAGPHNLPANAEVLAAIKGLHQLLIGLEVALEIIV